MFGFGQPYISPQEITEFEEVFNQKALPLETLFEKQNMTLIARLNDDKFNIYFEKTPAAVYKMLKYMLLPQDDAELNAWQQELGKDKLIKYQFYSSELFSANIINLINALFEFNQEEIAPTEDFSQIQEVLQDVKPSEMDNDNDDVQMGDSEPEKEQCKSQQIEDQENLGENSIQEEKLIQFKKEEETKESDIKFDPIGEVTGHQLFEYLISFLDQNPETVNPTSAGYFAKIITSIIYIKPKDFYVEIFEKDILKKFYKHLRTKSLADLLIKFVIYDGGNFQQTYLEERKGIISQLLKQFAEQKVIIN